MKPSLKYWIFILGISAYYHDSAAALLAGGDIVAAGAIRVGESLLAQGDLRAGADYGIYAGLEVQRANWDTSARVSAAVEPENLLSGHWVGRGGL